MGSIPRRCSVADGTKIEWTDATVNAINGCSVLSPGCTNCYAMRLAGTRMKTHPTRAGLTQDTKAGPVWTGEVRFSERALLEPLKWRRPRKIFWNAHGDTFHDNVPDEWIDKCFAVMALTPHHIHQVLTKRPERMRDYVRRFSEGSRYCSDHVCRILAPLGEHGYDTSLAKDKEQLRAAVRRCGGSPMHPFIMPNLWLGVSVEDRGRMLERALLLKQTPAAVHWWSAEPLLGDLGEIYPHLMPDWVVVGGESGPNARPMHPDWARSLRDQCAAAGVPFHFKQFGNWAPLDALRMDGARAASDGPVNARNGNVRDWMNRYVIFEHDAGAIRVRGHSFTGHGTDLVYNVGKKAAGRLLDGMLHDGAPA